MSGILRPYHGHSPGKSVLASKSQDPKGSGLAGKPKETPICPTLYESSGKDGFLIRGNSICPVPFQGIAAEHSVCMEQEDAGFGFLHDHNPQGSRKSCLVVGRPESDRGKVTSSTVVEGSDHRCQSFRLGCSHGKFDRPAEMDSEGTGIAHQCARAVGNMPRAELLDIKKLRGHPVRVQTDNATAVAYVNHQGGTKSRLSHMEVSQVLSWAERHVPVLSAIHIPGGRELESGLTQPPTDTPRRMVSAHTGVYANLPAVGYTGCRPDLYIPRFLFGHIFCAGSERR